MREGDLHTGSAPSTARGCERPRAEAMGSPSMKRRDFLRLGSSAAAAWPLPVFSQQSSNLPVVAVLTPGFADWARERLLAIQKGLQEAGLTEGVHYTLAVRFAEGQMDRLPGLVKELEAMNPAV